MKLIPKISRIRWGYCPICKRGTVFISRYDWLRDHYRCVRCKSIPRYRALIDVLECHFPNWRDLSLHESSPYGAASDMLARESSNYVASHYFPDIPPGEMCEGFRCENLENQTFEDCSFDLVVTQDVFEHVLHPDRAFREVARTLKVDGSHVFTVPWYSWQRTVVRAQEKDGQIIHLLQPQFHGNPISSNGSLVIREWGYDMFEFIQQCSGMVTVALRAWDPQKGIEAEFLDVFISRKPQKGMTCEG